MNYILGRRIKELRSQQGMSQEALASGLGTTRQRIARIEDGEIDISYSLIKQVADYFGVSADEITKVTEEEKRFTAMFREKNDNAEATEVVAKIEEMLNLFFAHEKLYHRQKELGRG